MDTDQAGPENFAVKRGDVQSQRDRGGAERAEIIARDQRQPIIEPHDLYEWRCGSKEFDINVRWPICQMMAGELHQGEGEPEHKAQARADQAELKRDANAADQIGQVRQYSSEL